MGEPLRVAVVGASGYTGLELLRILWRHPDAEISALTSRQHAGRALSDLYPAFRGLLDLRFEVLDPSSLARRVDFAFVALPHGAAAPVVRELLAQGLRVIDLSADFRLRDLDAYRSWYGEHPVPELLGEAVYGLPELHRPALRTARLVAAPGCYPTSVLLPLAPLLRRGGFAWDTVAVDAKSGVSGAGRRVEEAYLFAEIDENCRAYGVGGEHRHVPEMEEQASLAARSAVRVAFVPHLLPTTRGIVTSIYLRPIRPTARATLCEELEKCYSGEPFVRVLPEGELPRLAAVRGSNFCDLAAAVDARTGLVILLSALDNLVKGAGGQAVQCLNIMAGIDERRGLWESPLLP